MFKVIEVCFQIQNPVVWSRSEMEWGFFQAIGLTYVFNIKVVFIFDHVYIWSTFAYKLCVHFREIYCLVKAIDVCMQTWDSHTVVQTQTIV